MLRICRIPLSRRLKFQTKPPLLRKGRLFVGKGASDGGGYESALRKTERRRGGRPLAAPTGKTVCAAGHMKRIRDAERDFRKVHCLKVKEKQPGMGRSGWRRMTVLQIKNPSPGGERDLFFIIRPVSLYSSTRQKPLGPMVSQSGATVCRLLPSSTLPAGMSQGSPLRFT